MTAHTAEDFEVMARQMSYVSRPGDRVLVKAPETSMAAEFNGYEGEILEYRPGGWVLVRLDGHSDARFRADELLVL